MSDSAKKQRRVLIIGADGLRPDLINEELMPTVCRLARQGVRSADHHAVYPSHTRVNMTTLTSGTTPGRHGIMANTMLVPFVREDHIIDTSNYQHLDALEAATGGKATLVPTLGDILAGRGERLAVGATSSAGASMLWTHRHTGRIVNANSALGRADLYDLREKLGEIPPIVHGAQIERQKYAASAVTRLFLDDAQNRVIVLWMNEPDSSLHYFGLNSPESRQALQAVDASVASVLDAIQHRRLDDQFDIFFISDHGHTTVQAHKTLSEYLREAQKELGTSLALTTASDYIYATPSSNSGLGEPSTEALTPLVDWLVAQPWAGVVMAGRPDLAQLPGVIDLASVWNGQNNQRTPLLAVSPRWSDAVNEFGVAGQVMSLTTQSALRSSHGSASPFDMHATLIAYGPSFGEGVTTALPTGAVDLLPTVLHLLGIEEHTPVDGRVLWEMLRTSSGEPGALMDKIVVPAVPSNGADQQARLQIHQVGTTTYLHGSLQDDAVFAPVVPGDKHEYSVA